MNNYIPLPRKLIAISGDDTRQFLQGLITNDINKVNSAESIYALMLTPQGKFLYDFFIYEHEGDILIDCNASRIEEIKKKLSMYKLRSKIVIEDVSDKYMAVAVFPPSTIERGRGDGDFPDPRSPSLPDRKIIRAADYSGFIKGEFIDYEKLRINLCIASDLDMEDSFPLEYEMDIHNAIDYQKGCYVGQEVTARTHYRGTIRKKPCVVTAENNIDLSKYIGCEIIKGTSKIGIMRGSAGNIGLALIRMEDLEKAVGEIMVSGVGLRLKTP